MVTVIVNWPSNYLILYFYYYLDFVKLFYYYYYLKKNFILHFLYFRV